MSFTKIHSLSNKTQYVHNATDYDCLLITRDGSSGIFVGLPPRHRYWKESFQRINKEIGLSTDYSSFCEHTDEATGICHTPLKDKKTRVWWVGISEIKQDNDICRDVLGALCLELKKCEE